MSNTDKIKHLLQEMPFDVAMEEVSKLTNKVVTSSNGISVYSGRHPVHGSIHIIVPALGDSLRIYPFAIQEFD